jgi:hypothetical protein
VLDAHLLPRFGETDVAAIRPSDVEAFRARLAARGRGVNTIRNIIGVLSQVLGELIADRQLAFNGAPSCSPSPGRTSTSRAR